MKKNIIISLMLLFCVNLVAQQDLLMTQQWFSRINKNPAATGNSENIDLFLLSRFQWTGVDDSPQSNILNAHSYFDGIRSGLGIAFSYDQMGPGVAITDAKLAYAYHVNLKEDLLLSLGVSGGIYYKEFDPNKYVLADEEERGRPTFPNEKISELKPDFNFGVELSMPRFLFGGSITHLGKSRDELLTVTAAQQFYGYARGNFIISPSFDITPSIVYTNAGKVNMFTLGAMLFYKKMFWVGLDYRPPSPDVIFKDFDYSAMVAMIGVEWNFFRIGYSYDLSLGELSNLSSSTHEIMLSFMIPTKSSRTNKSRFGQ